LAAFFFWMVVVDKMLDATRDVFIVRRTADELTEVFP
jgi:hypothetical protein